MDQVYGRGGPFWISNRAVAMRTSDQGPGIGGMVLAVLTDAGYICLGAAVLVQGWEDG